jgi:hypothetical protein
MYKNKYHDHDFLGVLSKTPKTISVVSKKIGCSRTTAIFYLNELKRRGLADECDIDGGFRAWIKKDTRTPEVEIEGVVGNKATIELGTEYVGCKYKIVLCI